MNFIKEEKIEEKKISGIDKIRKMYKSIEYNNKIYLIGYGSVGRPLLFMILKIIKINPQNILVIDKEDKKSELKIFLDMGVRFLNKLVNKHNYNSILKDLSKNDIIIDCSYGLSTVEIIEKCQEKECHFINSCINSWTSGIRSKNMLDNTLYKAHQTLKNLNSSYPEKKFNAIVSMGCNPGNVSIWAKIGLEQINKNYGFRCETHAELAQNLGVQVIHISERDTQLTNKLKKQNEYQNTWSSDGESYYSEALGPVEISWGTHERKIPDNCLLNDNNFIIFDRMGCETFAQSVVPIYGKFIGNMISHHESNTIGETLKIEKDGQIIYKPSVYYVYHPCNSAKLSLEELSEKDYEHQCKYRLLTHEIVEGRDILGLTFYLNNKEVYWIGSALSIEEAREIAIKNQIFFRKQ
jgi:homospermidine synthase